MSEFQPAWDWSVLGPYLASNWLLAWTCSPHWNQAVFQLQTFWPGAGSYSRFWGVICHCNGGLVLNLRLLHVHQGNKTENICTPRPERQQYIHIIYSYSSSKGFQSSPPDKWRAGLSGYRRIKCKKEDKGLKYVKNKTQSISAEQWKDRKYRKKRL